MELQLPRLCGEAECPHIPLTQGALPCSYLRVKPLQEGFGWLPRQCLQILPKILQPLSPRSHQPLAVVPPGWRWHQPCPGCAAAATRAGLGWAGCPRSLFSLWSRCCLGAVLVLAWCKAQGSFFPLLSHGLDSTDNQATDVAAVSEHFLSPGPH